MASDQPDFTDSVMIALYPPPAVVTTLAVPGGLPPEELHCTVAYLGDAVDVDLQAVLSAAAAVVNRAPIVGAIAGHAVFTGDDDVLVALVDSADLEWLRRDLVDSLAAQGIEINAEHGYTAHITRRYLGEDTMVSLPRAAPMPVAFGALSVVHGERRIDLPFAGDAGEAIGPYARTAYAQGWAASGGPMTERVKAGCVAAVGLAITHAGDPGVLEATLRLGHLEGTWAAIFARREQIYTDHVAAITAAWLVVVRRINLAVAVRRCRDSLGLSEAADPANAAHRDLITRAIATAVLAAAIGHDGDPVGREGLIVALAATLRAAQAEGGADALAIAAQDVGGQFDLDAAYDDAFMYLGEVHDRFYAQAVGLLDQIAEAVALALAKVLARAVRDGLSEKDTLDAAQTALDSASVNAAVAMLIDFAISAAFTVGARSLFSRFTVATVNYLTAGDGVVCPLCEDAESGNPWPANDVPQPPQHHRCRCVLVAGDTLPTDAYDKYLEGS